MGSGEDISKIMEKAREEYLAYDPAVWSKEVFHEDNGGYLVVFEGRKPTERTSRNDTRKYMKEYSMCEVFAGNGHRMVMLEEVSGVSSPDVLIDGVPADLKRTTSVNNLEDYVLKAVGSQKGKLALIQFDIMDDAIARKLNKLSSMGVHGKYFITGKDREFDF